VIAPGLLTRDPVIQSPEVKRDDAPVVRRVDLGGELANAGPGKLGPVVEVPLVIECLTVKEKSDARERGAEENRSRSQERTLLTLDRTP
jgi:hypothetical protein